MGLGISEIATVEHLEASGELTAGQLMDRLHLTSGAVTALVTRLESSGHVHRQRSSRDGRVRLLSITESAVYEARQKQAGFLVEMQQRIEALSDEERDVVGSFLESLVETLENHSR